MKIADFVGGWYRVFGVREHFAFSPTTPLPRMSRSALFDCTTFGLLFMLLSVPFGMLIGVALSNDGVVDALNLFLWNLVYCGFLTVYPLFMLAHVVLRGVMLMFGALACLASMLLVVRLCPEPFFRTAVWLVQAYQAEFARSQVGGERTTQ